MLVNDTDTKLNLHTAAKMTGPTGRAGRAPATPPPRRPCTGGTLTRNMFVLGQIVGADTFDIGHIGLGLNGGGVAGLGVVGGASKARGCTGLRRRR